MSHKKRAIQWHEIGQLYEILNKSPVTIQFEVV